MFTCPALRPRWCPARLPWRGQDCCLPEDAYCRLLNRLPGLILLSTTIQFSEFNDAACVLALPLLRTLLFSSRTSVRLPTWWLAFGRVGLESASHPLGNIDMFQEVSPLFPRPEFISARPVIWLAIVSDLILALLVSATTAQCLRLTPWALLKIAREHVQKSGGNTAV